MASDPVPTFSNRHSIQVHEDEGQAHAKIAGRLDSAAILALRLVTRRVAERTRMLTLDCRDAATADSLGARALRTFLDQLNGRGITAKVLTSRYPAVHDAFARAELADYFSV